MPTELIPFVNAQRSGLEELAGATPSAMNVVVSSAGDVRRRPGIVAHAGAPASVIDAGGLTALHVDGSGRLFAVGAPSPASAVYYVLPGLASHLGDLDGTTRPTIAETEALLVLAQGQAIRKVELASLAMSDLGGTPPLASHVIAQNLRLLVNDVAVDKTKVNYSDQSIGTTDFSGHEAWPTSSSVAGGFFTAEARPDPVVALGENTNEVWVWGSKTLQVFSPDPTLVYAPVASRETGCSAPYSVIKADESFAWLDNKRRFVLSDGRGIEPIGGDAIQRDIDGMTRVSDCFGYRVLMGTVDALVWTFPVDGRTFVYQKGAGWGQWATRAGGAWGQIGITAHHQQDETAKNIVGTSDGKIGELSFDSSTDLDGSVISAHITTGFADRGSSALKLCDEVRLTLRRGTPVSELEPTGLLYWRDDLGGWNAPLPVSLGRSGDFETTITFYSLGSYRSRQWRFEFDGATPLVLVKAEERFTVLEG